VSKINDACPCLHRPIGSAQDDYISCAHFSSAPHSIERPAQPLNQLISDQQTCQALSRQRKMRSPPHNRRFGIHLARQWRHIHALSPRRRSAITSSWQPGSLASGSHIPRARPPPAMNARSTSQSKIRRKNLGVAGRARPKIPDPYASYRPAFGRCSGRTRYIAENTTPVDVVATSSPRFKVQWDTDIAGSRPGRFQPDHPALAMTDSAHQSSNYVRALQQLQRHREQLGQTAKSMAVQRGLTQRLGQLDARSFNRLVAACASNSARSVPSPRPA